MSARMAGILDEIAAFLQKEQAPNPQLLGRHPSDNADMSALQLAPYMAKGLINDVARYGKQAVTGEVSDTELLPQQPLTGQAKTIADSFGSGVGKVLNYQVPSLLRGPRSAMDDIEMVVDAYQSVRPGIVNAIGEPTVNRVEGAGLLGSMVIPGRAGKIKAYHGSPHDFDRFSLDNIGTGEGAQAYGHGLYFAEREGTAKSYRDALTEPRFTFDGKPADAIYTNEIRERWADVYDELTDDDLVQDWKLNYLNSVAENGGDYDKASEALDSLVEKTLKGEETTYDFSRLDEFESDIDPNGVYDLNEPQRHLDAVLSNMSQADSPSTMDIVLSGLSPDELRIYERYVEPKVEYIKPEGKMYQVDLDASPDEFLDYDIPLKDQPKNIQNAFKNVYRGLLSDDPILNDIFASKEDIDFGTMGLLEKSQGSQSYNTLASKVGGDAKLSQLLSKQGVKGIKYADAQTRFSPKGRTNNYVVFDDKTIEIARKYGVSIPVAGAILAGTMTPEEAQASEQQNRQGLLSNLQ